MLSNSTFSVSRSFVVAPLACLCTVGVAPAALASGKVIVVDAAMGPGAFAPSIDIALLFSQPGDTLLVRSGTYGTVWFLKPGMAVVADTGADVHIAPESQSLLNAGGAGVSAIAHGLHFESGLSLMGFDGGRAWISDCTAAAGTLETAVDAVVSRCRFDGLAGNGVLGPSGVLVYSDGGLGARVYSNAVSFYACQFAGGPGITGGGSQPGTNGGDGVRVEGSAVVFASDVSASGGAGGASANSPSFACAGPGSGGSGMVVLASADARAWGGQYAGGAGGAAVGLTCSVPGPAGATVWANAPSASFEALGAAALPTLLAPGVAREGQPAQVVYGGELGFAFIVYSTSHAAAHPLLGAAPLFLQSSSGALHVGGAFQLVPLGLTASATFHFQLADLGAGVETERLFVQAVRVDPATFGVAPGEARALVLLDAAF